MIRYKSQPSQAKYERYPAIIIFFGKSHQNAENRESHFTGKYLFFHVLPVIENFAKSSVAHRRLAKQLRICSTRPPSA